MSRSVVVRVMAVVVAAVAVAAAGVAKSAQDQRQDRTLVAYFTDASPLEPGSQVRAAGADVGKVERIALEAGEARVTFTVDPSVLPLHRDARMRIRPVNLLGESYVELDGGSPSQPYLPEAVVPVERTSSAVDLQDVINTFDEPTSVALAALVTSVGEGMHDSGAEAAAAIKALAPAMGRSEELGAVLREQNDVLNELVDRVQPVAQALAAKDGESMNRLVASTERTVSTLAANQRALDATLAELPGTLTEARRTLRELAGVSDAATPTLKAIRPVTDNLSKITGELQRFADAADPALASLKPVLDHADHLLEQAAPVVARLREAGPDVRATAKDLRPLGDELLDKHLGDLMEFVKKWSMATNGRDALGHYWRGLVFVSPETLQDLASSNLPVPVPDEVRTGRPATPEDPGKALPELEKVLPQNLPGDSGGADPDNATGLTRKQEQSMLDQLLGGV